MNTFDWRYGMKIFLIGATGAIGSRILDEAVRRGHTVLGTTRSAEKLAGRQNVSAFEADTADVERLAEGLRGSDAAICSVKWNENSIDDVLAAVRRSGVKRVLFVVGAGSLLREDGRTHLEHVLEAGGSPPPSSPAAAAALDVIRTAEDLEWSAISPPLDIYPGERTGKFELGGDQLLRPTAGEKAARISREDFAVAILDEIEHPRHLRRRFTAAN